MKAWMLAGLMTIAPAPMAYAAETAQACQVDDVRRAAQERSEAPAPAANVTGVARSAMAQRDATETAARSEPRRRTGKRIPDAELIGPRSTL